MNTVFIGIVNNGTFQPAYPEVDEGVSLRLTSTSMQDSLPPENGELNLIEYQKCAIAVTGSLVGRWIYSARVVDTGEPIVTALVRQVFKAE